MSEPAREPDLASLFLLPLDRLGVAYMATGGYAAIAYGEPRLTVDVDVVVDLRPRDLRAVHAAFDVEGYYVPPLDVMAEECRRPAYGHFNLIHGDSGLRADVYVAGDDATNAEALERRRRIDVGPGEVYVAPPEYVIAHKLKYRREGGSDKHVRDVRAMLAVSGDAIDRALLADLVRRLGVRAQWDEVVGAARPGA